MIQTAAYPPRQPDIIDELIYDIFTPEAIA
jgi:hypothetical protein